MQHDHVLKKFNFDPFTLPPGSGGGLWANICYHDAAWGGNFSITVMLIYRHWVIMAYNEKLSDIKVWRNVKFITHKNQYSFCISLNLIQKNAKTQSKFCKLPPDLNLTCIV